MNNFNPEFNFNPERSIKQSQEKNVEYTVKICYSITGITPKEFDPENPKFVSVYEIKTENGEVLTIGAKQPIFKIERKRIEGENKNIEGENINNIAIIEVPAYTVEHIITSHIQGQEAGSTIETEIRNLPKFLKEIAERLPDQLEFKEIGGIKQAEIQIDLGEIIGYEGIASVDEVKSRRIITDEDVQKLESAREEVFRLNREGSDEEKKKFVEEFNQKMTGRNVKLGLRGGSIVPFFNAEKQPTSKIVIIIREEVDENNQAHYIIYTIFPGRLMPRLPCDRAYNEIMKKIKAGEPLTEEEQELLKEQENSQEQWWTHGFIESW